MTLIEVLEQIRDHKGFSDGLTQLDACRLLDKFAGMAAQALIDYEREGREQPRWNAVGHTTNYCVSRGDSTVDDFLAGSASSRAALIESMADTILEIEAERVQLPDYETRVAWFFVFGPDGEDDMAIREVKARPEIVRHNEIIEYKKLIKSHNWGGGLSTEKKARLKDLITKYPDVETERLRVEQEDKKLNLQKRIKRLTSVLKDLEKEMEKEL